MKPSTPGGSNPAVGIALAIAAVTALLAIAMAAGVTMGQPERMADLLRSLAGPR